MGDWPSKEIGTAGVAVLDCVHDTPKDAGTGYPYIAIPNIKQGRIDLLGVRRITEADLVRWTSRHKPRGGDVLVTRRGRVGDTATIPDGLPCAIGQNLVLLRSDGSEFDQRYLAWACRSPAWWAEVDRLLNVGAVFQSLNVRDLPKFRLPRPPIDEQRRIAAVLGAFDDLIETNRQLAVSLEEEARRAWRQLVSVEAPPTAALTDCAKVILGGTPSRKNPDLWGGEIPWLNSGVANDFRVLRGSEGITQEGYDRSSTKMVPAGTTLIAITGATLGQVTRTEIAACGNQSLVGVYAEGDEVLSDHLYLAVSDDIAQVVRHATGGAQQHVNKGNVEQMPFPVLTDGLRAGIEAGVSPLLAGIGPLLTEATDLTRNRDVLLPLLMSGRVRVQGVEEVV